MIRWQIVLMGFLVGSGLQGGVTIDLSRFEIFTGAAIASSGTTLALLDVDQLSMILFSMQGEQLATTGKRGQGRSEFSQFSGIQWLADQRCYLAFDSANGRMTRIDESGNTLGEVPLLVVFEQPFLDRAGTLYFTKARQGGELPANPRC